MEWKDNISSQLFNGKQVFVADIPHACQAEENDDWFKNKAEASKKDISETIQFVRKMNMEIHNEYDDDDDDEESDESVDIYEDP